MLSVKHCQVFLIEDPPDVKFGEYMIEKKEKNPHAVHLGQLGRERADWETYPGKATRHCEKSRPGTLGKKKEKNELVAVIILLRDLAASI